MLRVRLETALAIVLTAAALATAVWPTWIESITTLEPDGGSGETEWWLVLSLAVAAAVAALVARRHHRALTATPRTAG